jgi:uncharacterized heparinase superfamily protein
VTAWLAKHCGTPDELFFLNLRPPHPRGGPVDWRAAAMPKLWRYNLHYFDYLQDAQRSLEARRALIADWIARVPTGAEDAWEPFPLSLRVVNWIKFFLRPENRLRLPGGWLESLYRQALWLERNIEHHLLGNHLFKNAKALLFAGLFFRGGDAFRWRRTAGRLLQRQIREQILPDGGHFERSPMYHAMILEDCLDLVNLTLRTRDARIVRLTRLLKSRTACMASFLKGMTLPDGDIALFNDAAFGVESLPESIFDYFQRVTGDSVREPHGTLWWFPHSGYYIMAPRPTDRLVIDCGPVGPDYQPGHAHCDTLSFELALGGRRVIVDSGCLHYEPGALRRYNRGNAGHNTVTIDGVDQSEVWGAHRCGRRAKPWGLPQIGHVGHALFFQGVHDGYRRLRGAPLHQRRIRWAGDALVVNDHITGTGRHAVESRLHIHPDLTVAHDRQGVRVLDGTRPILHVQPAGPGRLSIENGWYCPQFNIQRPCPVLTITCLDAVLPLDLGWDLRMAAAGPPDCPTEEM